MVAIRLESIDFPEPGGPIIGCCVRRRPRLRLRVYMALAFDVGEIDVVILVRREELAEIAAHRLQFRFAPNELIGFPQILHAENFDPLDHRGFARIRRRHDDRRVPASARFERDRQHAFHGAHRAIECELADETETVERVALDFFRGGDHPECDRQIEARTFLFYIGGARLIVVRPRGQK